MFNSKPSDKYIQLWNNVNSSQLKTLKSNWFTQFNLLDDSDIQEALNTIESTQQRFMRKLRRANSSNRAKLAMKMIKSIKIAIDNISLNLKRKVAFELKLCSGFYYVHLNDRRV